MSCPWPKGFIGFGFEKPENCSQNGSENPPHAAHFFWPKIHGVLRTVRLIVNLLIHVLLGIISKVSTKSLVVCKSG